MFLINIRLRKSDKAILENGGTSLFRTATKIKKCVINHLVFTLVYQNLFLNGVRLKTFDKAVNTYPSTVKFVSEFLMTQKMCDKAVNI